MKYSDLMAEWLKSMGYTHCFYVAGGNIMHLLASSAKHFKMVSVIHEVAAGVAAEYFNEASTDGSKAFALVTAGPGMTNLVTALAGAFLESRELLVIGGQVKTADLSRGTLRQRGIQEIDGVAIARPVCSVAELLDEPVSRARMEQLVLDANHGRKGPVFLELPLDIQGRSVDRAELEQLAPPVPPALPQASDAVIAELAAKIRAAQRPLLLLGGGVSRATAQALQDRFAAMGLPVTTTWNAADRIAADHPNYFGRPNTWGQRYANLLLQQSDLLLAMGTRLGMQQTGFNWQQFVPKGQVVHVDCDLAELEKGHPRVEHPIHADANSLLLALAQQDLGEHGDWLAYCREVKAALPLIEQNSTGEAYISPYRFVEQLSRRCHADDVVIPCSSGGAFTVMMQTFAQQRGQTIVTNKGLASMGYGLSGAIGAALAHPDRRTLLVEGDGGFAQNLQEIGTAAVNKLNLKMFIFDDNGYASIRMTQKNYFGGSYIGCDINSGLGLPDWEQLFKAWNVPALRIGKDFDGSADFAALFDAPGPAAFIVSIDPEQSYFPKIMSRVTESGAMESNPLHQMSPALDDALQRATMRYLD
ncbi:thiamine pyrophosphate-binding protein [Pseudoduganella aquatica]|uniref:Thiamine pyrophosphate-binding protein n=1 Tax=Pseudoduganella aquatica TaxID=2660641 RepID=A0A7X4HF25_9BURK|nr:thiamine pyrophosphate-binding protein [Pseudoduganella aquatica]MYN10034.1 thiamine pyrophosphate-binding protein [Pseudoduganella aquatica]